MNTPPSSGTADIAQGNRHYTRMTDQEGNNRVHQHSPSSPLAKHSKTAPIYSSTATSAQQPMAAATSKPNEQGTTSRTGAAFSTPLRINNHNTVKGEIDGHYYEEEDDMLPLTKCHPDEDDTKAQNEVGDKSCREKLKVVPGPYWVHNIVLNEACERFAFYGLRAILTLFMKERLKYSEGLATSVYEFFTGSVYVTGVFGGWIADTYLGKFRTILAFSSLYCIGTIFLVLAAVFEMDWIMFIGLVCIAFGTGGIKPCVAAFGAEQYGEQNDSDITSFFLAFYFSINIGSVLSFIITPILRSQVSYVAAFSASTFVLMLSIVVFVLPYKRYIKAPPNGSVLSTAWRVLKDAIRFNGGCCSLIRRRGRPKTDEQIPDGGDSPVSRQSSTAALKREDGLSHEQSNSIEKPIWLDAARVNHDYFTVESVKAVWNLVPILCVLPFFWMLFDQQGSSWTLQAQNMDRDIGGFKVEPDNLGLLNPLFVVVMIPFLGKFIFPLMEKLPCKLLYPTPLRKMGIGMVSAAGSFVIAGFVQVAIRSSLESKYGSGSVDKESDVSVFWILPQYFLITFSEILVSTTGLEWMYTQAPHTMRGMIIALWYLSTGIGDYIAGVLFSAFSFLNRYQFFFLFAGLMFISSLLFILVAFQYKPLESIQQAKREFDKKIAKGNHEETIGWEAGTPAAQHTVLDGTYTHEEIGDPNESPVNTKKLRSHTKSGMHHRDSGSSFSEVPL